MAAPFVEPPPQRRDRGARRGGCDDRGDSRLHRLGQVDVGYAPRQLGVAGRLDGLLETGPAPQRSHVDPLFASLVTSSPLLRESRSRLISRPPGCCAVSVSVATAALPTCSAATFSSAALACWSASAASCCACRYASSAAARAACVASAANSLASTRRSFASATSSFARCWAASA